MSNSQYTGDQIQVLEGLEAVRKRPGMYIGTTSSRGLHHLVWEIVDNSIDEHLAGHCDEITVRIHPDQSVSVTDNGRGIPTNIHTKMGVPTLEVVLTVLHAGGKFGGEESGYKVSGGLHGVGAAVVNALSEQLTATVHREGKAYQMSFSRGKKTVDLSVTDIDDAAATGTTIHYKPDPEIFTETIEYEFKTIHDRLRQSAFLNPGLTIHLVDECRKDEETGAFVQVSFCYEGGISDYVAYLNENKKTLHERVFYTREEQDGVIVEVALQYQDSYSKDGIFSFANNIKTPEGGTHETGFKTAITTVIKDYIEMNNLIKGGELPTGEDTRIGLVSVVSVKVPEPQFEGQTKTKLGNSEVRSIVDNVVGRDLRRFFEENPDVGANICTKVIDSFEERMAARKARQERRKKKSNENGSFTDPGKLVPCSSKDSSKTELFIVEGDSAGGSAKQGRDKVFQAILPLRGKVLNTEKSPMDKITANNEIQAMRVGIGTDMGEHFDYEKLKFNKVIIMTDADIDGKHISILLLTFFHRFMPELIEKGHIFVARPPLYKVAVGKKEQYAFDDVHLDEILNALPPTARYTLQRYKGLGEMDATQLWDTTMDPERRTLVQVTMDDAAKAEYLFSQLMGDDPAARKEYIEMNGHTAKDIDA